MPTVGDVWSHKDFYVDSATGEFLTKYLLVLAVRPDGDIVYRLLTSREYNRTKAPTCHHEGDRPGFYLSIPQPTGLLNKETWLDLREEEDFDAKKFSDFAAASILQQVHMISIEQLCPALRCAAYAQDTTRSQKNHIMAARAALSCP